MKRAFVIFFFILLSLCTCYLQLHVDLFKVCPLLASPQCSLYPTLYPLSIRGSPRLWHKSWVLTGGLSMLPGCKRGPIPGNVLRVRLKFPAWMMIILIMNMTLMALMAPIAASIKGSSVCVRV